MSSLEITNVPCPYAILRSVAVNGSVSVFSYQVTPSSEYKIPFAPPSATNLPLPQTIEVLLAIVIPARDNETHVIPSSEYAASFVLLLNATNFPAPYVIASYPIFDNAFVLVNQV